MLLLPVRNIPAGGVACNILCARRSCGGECIVRVECLLPPFHRTSSSSPVDRWRFYINYCYFTHHRVCVCVCARACACFYNFCELSSAVTQKSPRTKSINSHGKPTPLFQPIHSRTDAATTHRRRATRPLSADKLISAACVHSVWGWFNTRTI